MQLQLEVKEKNIRLVLLDGEKSLDEEGWVDENNLLEKFFPILDDMLKRNHIDIMDIDDFILKTNIPSGYTTARIAQTIIKTLQFAHNS
ncbi:MAG: hypothetical protein U9Q12_04755 [Patescibacteria group bacterium]|nr:hypothetical protein [Patescibacteria group bacterium]